VISLLATVLAATPSGSPIPGHAKVLNDDTVSPGWLGLVVFLALAVATALLLRSFRRQLAKVPPTFDQPAPPRTGPPATGDGG
jgi:hypothetical protein